MLGIMF